MKAVIIEDETAAVTSLRAMLTENQVVQVDVIAELESVEECVDWFRNNPAPEQSGSGSYLYGHSSGGWIGLRSV